MSESYRSSRFSAASKQSRATGGLRRNACSMLESLEGRMLLSVTPSLTPNRISGVAPLSVHFDATGTTSTATAVPLHEVEYLWNFGDAGSGDWANSGKSRNSDSGPVAGHVFEQPGTYTVTLNVRDPAGSIANQTVTITVQDPNTVFSGTNTIAFSTIGDFSGAPAGALQVTTDSLSTIATYAAPGKRLLLHRGETWNTSAGVTINQLGPGLVGAYGTGAKPKIVATGTGFILSDPVPHMDDWRFVDLDMRGATTKAAIVFWGTADNILIDRVDIADFGSGITGSPSRLDFWNNNGNPGHTLHDGTAIVNSTITHGQGGQGLCGIFLFGQRMQMMGNSVTNMEGVEHSVRMTWLEKTVISHNLIGKPAVAKHNLKLHAPQFEAPNTLGFHHYSEQIVVSDNTFDAGPNAWIVGIGPQDHLKDERVRDVIFQNNFLPATISTQVGLKIWSQQVTVRNNIFTLLRDWAVGIGLEQRGIEPAPANNNVYNNTVYSPSNSIYGVWVDTDATNTTAKNNLVKGYQAVRNLGTGTVASNNLLTATPGFVSATPVSAADFKLSSTSPAKDAGTSVPLWKDLGGTARPAGTAYDIGAWEFVNAAPVTIVSLQPSSDWVTTDNVAWQRNATAITGEFGGPVGTDKIDRLDFDMVNKLNAAATNTVPSGVFYGGVAGVRYNNTSTTVNDNKVRNGVAPAFDSYQTGFRSSSGLEDRVVTALLWRKSDFLNGGATATVDLDNSSSLSVRGRGMNAGTVGRWLVQVGGQMYISNATFSVSGTTTTTYTLNLSTTSTTWAPINFAGGTNSTSTGLFSSPGAFAAMTPTNIEAVGFYTEKNTGSAVDARFLFNSFSVTATSR